MSEPKFDRMAFVRTVEEVVCAIPRGMVLTYGDVAAIAGEPGQARLVGKILGSIGFDSRVPCHRVVNFQGRTAPHWAGQIALLKAEGVAFTSGSLVVMRRHRWNPDSDI